MNKPALLVFFCVVAAGAYWLGQRNPAAGPVAPESAPVATSASPVNSADSPRIASPQAANEVSAEPPRTFRGADGRAHLISYEPGIVADSSDRDAVRAGLLADMRNHPRNITRAYGLEPGEMAQIIDGSRPFPEQLLPAAR